MRSRVEEAERADVAVTSRPVLPFFVLVVLLSVPLWVLGLFVESPEGTPMDLPVSALMFACPFLAAWIMLWRQGSAGEIRHLLRRAVDPRTVRPRTWYFPAFLTIPVIVAAVDWCLRLTGSADGERGSIAALPLLLVLFLVSAVGEETGWMGYAVEPMRARWGALVAGLFIGAFWAIWHVLPLVQADRSFVWIAWWFLGTVALRVLIVWLYVNAGRSVVVAVIVHAFVNVGMVLLPDYTTHVAPVALFGCLSALSALVVTVLWGPTLARFRLRS
jgi:hypothetical protein